MSLKTTQKVWDELGKKDPLWAVLSWDEKIDNKWDRDEFFAIGKQEIIELFDYLSNLKISINKNKVLDFGCGVGRLSQSLSKYFNEVNGVDISQSMIDKANEFNQYKNKCKYYLNKKDDLSIFADDSFDFIYSNITLQHIEPVYAKKYIKEFVRILNKGGIAVFQMPSHRFFTKKVTRFIFYHLPKFLVEFYRQKKYGSLPPFNVYGIKKQKLTKFLKNLGVEIIDIKQDSGAGNEWISYKYCIKKFQ